VDREHREGALHRHEAAQPAVASLELKAGAAVGRGAGARTAVALQVHAEHAKLPELGAELRRQPARAPGIDDDRQEAAANPVAHRRGDQLLLVAQLAGKSERVLD